jgi:uncharacterized protein
MRILTLFILSFVFISSHAQKIAVSPQLLADSASLGNNIPTLAKEVIARYRETDKSTYFDNLVRYQLAATEYAAAIASLDSLREINKDSKRDGTPATGIQFRCYALAKMAQATSNKPFDQSLVEILTQQYAALPDRSKRYAATFFGSEPGTFKIQLDKMIASARGKDSISVTEAGALVRMYNSWNVARQVMAPGLDYLVREEKRIYEISDSVLISTKDGSKLSALVIRSRLVSGPQPVILVYNIYADKNGDKRVAQNAAARGYTSIVVNTRGKKLSPDAIEPFEHDGKDAYDVIDWISRQPWCNGKIGMYGGSYLGFSQWSATKKLHPALKTIVPQVAVGIGIDYPMHNSVFMSYMLRWIHYVSNNKYSDDAEFGNSVKWDTLFKAWYRSGRSFRALDTMEGRPDNIFQRWLDHPSYDSYWQNMVPYGKEFANINIPILTTTGYYDDDQLGAMYYYQQHHTWNKQPNHYLLIGPYDHGGAQSAASPEVLGYKIDPVANISINETVIQWFDHFLKNGPMPAMLKDKVNYQVMGANTWRSAPSIKAVSKDTLTFYFSDVVRKNGYKLSAAKPSAPGVINQEIDYRDREAEQINTNIIADTIEHSNKLVFVSDPLEKDIVMTGSFQAMLSATLNKKDIDIAIRLYEWQPDGKYFWLSMFLGRASYTKDRSRRQLLQPGREEQIPVKNSFFASRQLKKGSRIVAVLGMNNDPQWQVNYGTGKNVSDETIKDGAVPLEIKWSNKSYIKLPVEK